MEEKKYTEAGTDIDDVKKLNAAFGLSYNDAKALFAQASEVHTVDDIPLDPLRANAKAEKSRNKKNVFPSDFVNPK